MTQEQQFTLILQTLQQLRDVYGDSVDKIVQGNTSNIVKLFNNESNPLANKTINLTLKNSKKEYVKSIKTNEKGLLNISSISQMKLQIKCFIFRRRFTNFSSFPMRIFKENN